MRGTSKFGGVRRRRRPSRGVWKWRIYVIRSDEGEQMPKGGEKWEQLDEEKHHNRGGFTWHRRLERFI